MSDTISNKLRSEERFGGGLNYFLAGHGANIKILFERVYNNQPVAGSENYRSFASNQILLQIQYLTF